MCLKVVFSENTSLPVGECKLQIPGFECFKKNRTLCHRHLIWARKNLKAMSIHLTEISCQECVSCKVTLKNKKLLYVLCTVLAKKDVPNIRPHITKIKGKVWQKASFLHIIL